MPFLLKLHHKSPSTHEFVPGLSLCGYYADMVILKCSKLHKAKSANA